MNGLGFRIRIATASRRWQGAARFVATLMLLGTTDGVRSGAGEPVPGDRWIVETVQYPEPYRIDQVRSNDFAALQARAGAGGVELQIPAEALPAATNAQAHVSVDPPGHWPARDWRMLPMERRGACWTACVPVFDLDLPLVYFVSSAATGAPVVSPMRVATPRELGLSRPTRLFWSQLDGFEEGLEGWRVLAPRGARLQLDSTSHRGRHALSVRVPPGHHSVTIATTRLRAWHLWRFDQRALSLALRTRDGTARARFTLVGYSGTTNQTISVFPRDVRLTPEWSRVELLFTEFPHAPLHAVDLFAVEFIGEGTQQLLVDDVQVVGRESGARRAGAGVWHSF